MTSNGADTVAEPDNDPPPLFVTENDCTDEHDPTSTSPNDRLPGDTTICGGTSTPVPLTDRDAPPPPENDTDRDTLPLDVGQNRTRT